eukprot:7028675-Pyramimonas_sp.AAC.1
MASYKDVLTSPARTESDLDDDGDAIRKELGKYTSGVQVTDSARSASPPARIRSPQPIGAADGRTEGVYYDMFENRV